MSTLFLIFHGRFPSEKAAALFAAKSAESFARLGRKVEVLVPRRKGVTAQDAFEYFGVEKSFKVTELATVDLFDGPFKRLAFWTSYVAFSLSCALHLRRVTRPGDIAYSNESLPLWAASFTVDRTLYEMHDFPESKLGLFRRFLSKVKLVLIHNRWKAERAQQVFKVPAEKILIEANAVDISAFDIATTREGARAALGLPSDGILAVYTGHLYGWKGVETLARAARRLPHGFSVAFVGGTKTDVEAFRSRHAKTASVMILGHRPHAEIPVWQKAADVLVLPNTAKEAISAFYTSPMKLFEYMASRRPIVASDIPSVREVIDQSAAVLVAADDEGALAEGIVRAAFGGAESGARIAAAYDRVRERTWDKRARRIMDFIDAHE